MGRGESDLDALLSPATHRLGLVEADPYKPTSDQLYAVEGQYSEDELRILNEAIARLKVRKPKQAEIQRVRLYERDSTLSREMAASALAQLLAGSTWLAIPLPESSQNKVIPKLCGECETEIKAGDLICESELRERRCWDCSPLPEELKHTTTPDGAIEWMREQFSAAAGN